MWLGAIFSSPASSSLEAWPPGFPVASSRRLVASAAPSSISSPWIIRFYTPLTKHQFLQWIWRLCYKNNYFYDEFDRPLQIISKSCKKHNVLQWILHMFQKHHFLHWIMHLFSNSTWSFKNIMFNNELCYVFSKTSVFTMNYTPCGWEPFSAAQPAVA